MSGRRSALRRRSGRLAVMSLLGVRMMFHDRAKLVGTLLGVVFATVLVNQQVGILLCLLYKNTMFVDNAGCDVWIVPPGTDNLQGGGRISVYALNQARVADGVAWAEPMVLGTASVALPGGGTEPVQLVGTRLTHLAGGPWSFVAGEASALELPDTVFFEDSFRTRLGGLNLGSVRELSGRRVVAAGFTWGLIPFGPPYAFTEYDTARSILGVDADQTGMVLVRVQPGVDPEAVRADLARRLPTLQVLTTQQFHDSVFWTLLRDQLGVSFGTSTAFAVIVGFVIVALSMFSAVVDNVREFGTLKAMGATTFDLAKLLLVQSLTYAGLGTTIGLFLVTRIGEGMRGPSVFLLLPWQMYAGSFVLMTVLCVAASSLALLRVRNVEPGMVFR